MMLERRLPSLVGRGPRGEGSVSGEAVCAKASGPGRVRMLGLQTVSSGFRPEGCRWMERGRPAPKGREAGEEATFC